MVPMRAGAGRQRGAKTPRLCPCAPPIRDTSTVSLRAPIRVTSTVSLHAPIRVTSTVSLHAPIRVTSTVSMRLRSTNSSAKPSALGPRYSCTYSCTCAPRPSLNARPSLTHRVPLSLAAFPSRSPRSPLSLAACPSLARCVPLSCSPRDPLSLAACRVTLSRSPRVTVKNPQASPSLPSPGVAPLSAPGHLPPRANRAHTTSASALR